MKKIFFAMLLSVVALCAMNAQSFSVDGVYYEVLSSGSGSDVEVVDNPSYYSGSITVPATVTYNSVTYNVVAIGDNAFASCSGLSAISLPSSIVEIGSSAFELCTSLAAVTIPDAVVTMGNLAFGFCSTLASVTLSSSLTALPEQAFQGCTSLQSIVVPASVTVIDYWAFTNCTALTSVTLNEGLVRIKNDAFSYCSALTTLTIPNSVVSLGNYVFQSNSDLTTLTLGSGLDSIGYGCFELCESLTSVTLPASVSYVSDYAFGLCTGMTSFQVEAGNGSLKSSGNVLYSIDGTQLLYAATGLTGFVTLLPEVKDIAGFAFYHCADIDSVEMGSDVDSIGLYAFAGCTSLSAIVCNAATPPTIDSTVFDGVTKTIPLYVPSGSLSLYAADDHWKEFTTMHAISTADVSGVLENRLMVYPNPTADVLRFKTDESYEGKRLTLIDVTGKVVHQQVLRSMSDNLEVELNVSHLAKGCYVLSIDHESVVVLIK